MLGKLIKYDFRSLVRKFAPLWGGLAALAALNGFTIRHVLSSGNFHGFLNFLLGVLPVILLVVLWVTLAIMALVFIVERFYKGLLGDEGYLMFTLPVTNAQHIASKTISALILLVITAAVACVSGLLLLVIYDYRSVADLFAEISRMLRQTHIPGRVWWIAAEFCLLCLVGTVTSTLQIYTAISLGHLARNHRGGVALAAYVGINVALSVLGRVLISVLDPVLRALPLDKLLDGLSFTIDGSGAAAGNMFGFMGAIFGLAILWEAVKGAAFFLGSKAILNHRLNLE